MVPGLATMSALCFNTQSMASTCTVRSMSRKQSKPTRNTILKGPVQGTLTQHPQPGKCADGYCTIRKWSGGLAEESWAAFWIFTDCTPGSQIYVTWLRFWLGAYVKFQPVGWPG